MSSRACKTSALRRPAPRQWRALLKHVAGVDVQVEDGSQGLGQDLMHTVRVGMYVVRLMTVA